MINTHNWNKLQLTAEKHLPAVDRRKLLTAFSHSVKRERERDRERNLAQLMQMRGTCLHIHVQKHSHNQHACHVCICLHTKMCRSKPNVCSLMMAHSPVCVDSLHVCVCPWCWCNGSCPGGTACSPRAEALNAPVLMCGKPVSCWLLPQQLTSMLHCFSCMQVCCVCAVYNGPFQRSSPLQKCNCSTEVMHCAGWATWTLSRRQGQRALADW